MIREVERNGGRSRQIEPDSVRGVLDSWLTEDLEGADRVRVVIARRLAAELDNPDLPAYVVPRITGALVAVVAQIDAGHTVVRVGASRSELHRLLKDVQ